MTLPNLPLPTDNLYKFMALTGLLGVVLIVYYMETKQVALSKEVRQELFEYNLHLADTLLLSEKQKDINQRLFAFAVFMKYRYPNEVSIKSIANRSAMQNNLDTISGLNWMYFLVLNHPEYMPLLSEVIETNTELRENADKTLKTAQEIDHRLNLYIESQKKYESNRHKLSWLLASSIFLTILGFALWYYRVQIYQDQILKNSIELPKKKDKKVASPD
jgi:hypothetical protein